ncbi:hypothetical protein TARUN_3783 [Trichoderma arundinaceum]|uniref:SnoaL-like domain-containing protein n=1 Tax=Trichoderma arundinaceum TaxID=490622 RepID=A0A395NQU6_TRIAR|nr:hypothetical protein TARUN_3783 [Trichoderma arundinaceum]
MASNLTISPEEARDRLAIRQVIDRYAHCADRRLADEQMSLFTEETHFTVYMQGEGSQPSQVVRTREDLRPVFEFLLGYTHTTHINGQSIIDIGADGKTASGETYCIAHHVSEKDGQRQLYVANLRYQDTLKKGEDGKWLFSERKLYLDCITGCGYCFNARIVYIARVVFHEL